MGFLDGAGGSIVGGAIGAVGSLLGGNMAANNQQALAGMNYEAQKEFAQNGIRWKVADAKAAGIHPLYALGASTQGYSPSGGYGGDYGISDAFNQFGQGISRAVEAKQTKEERDRLEVRQALQDMVVMDKLAQEKRMNDAQVRLIDSEIARNMASAQFSLKRTALPPAMPSSDRGVISGQGDSLDSLNQFAWIHDEFGRKTIGPSPDYKQLYEDVPVAEFWPIILGFAIDAYHRIGRIPVAGRVWDPDKHDYVSYKKGDKRFRFLDLDRLYPGLDRRYNRLR